MQLILAFTVHLCYILGCLSFRSSFSTVARLSGGQQYAVPGGGDFKTSEEVASLRNEAVTRFLGKDADGYKFSATSGGVRNALIVISCIF
jgi:hypothetical protein